MTELAALLNSQNVSNNSLTHSYHRARSSDGFGIQSVPHCRSTTDTTTTTTRTTTTPRSDCCSGVRSPLSFARLPDLFAVWRPYNQRWDFLKPIRDSRDQHLLRISIEYRPWTHSVLTSTTSSTAPPSEPPSEPLTTYYDTILRPSASVSVSVSASATQKRRSSRLEERQLFYHRSPDYFTVSELTDRDIVTYRVPILMFVDWRCLPRSV